MDFDPFLDQAWNEHATAPAAVAERLATEGLALLQAGGGPADEAQVGALAALAQHVHGAHLAAWAEGMRFQQQLAALPGVAAGGATALALQRHIGVLQWAGGLAAPDPALPAAELTRLQALTAGTLALHDAPRAAALLHAAQASAAALPDADPAVRTLAASANNLASALHDETELSPAQQALMLQGAALSRAAWARAGTWLEVERAEYRLALCHARAGDIPPALAHAQACLALVQGRPEPGAPALEHFFAWEALARVQRDAGDGAGHAASQAQAAHWFARLDPADQAWCRASLDALHP